VRGGQVIAFRGERFDDRDLSGGKGDSLYIHEVEVLVPLTFADNTSARVEYLAALPSESDVSATACKVGNGQQVPMQFGDIEDVLQDYVAPLISGAHPNVYVSLADALDGAVITQDDRNVPGKARKLLKPISVGAHGVMYQSPLSRNSGLTSDW
jgi:hypothetical protein